MNDLLEKNTIDNISQQTNHPFILEINSINKELENTLFNATNINNFSQIITDLSQRIINLVNIYPDLALANITINKTGLYTIRHCINTAILAYTVARSMNKSSRDILGLLRGCLTMNISLIHEHEKIHAQSTLTKEQKDLIYNHANESTNILRNLGITDQTWLTHVLDHHACDVETYPETNKPRNKILESTKIIFIADRYCALISGRPHRKPYLPNSAIHFILTKGKNIIDPALAVCFIKVLGMYPPGTFVKLTNGDIAVVSYKTDKKMFPIVHSLIDNLGNVYSNHVERNTEHPIYKIREVIFLETQINLNLPQIWEVSNSNI